jgi:cytochrome c-type biogenesis protein CcmH
MRVNGINPRSGRLVALLWLLASLAGLLAPLRSALAVDSTPPLPNPALQQRYLVLTHEFRCMQCQGEALADSNVSLAAEVRLEVHDLLLQGLTDQQIRDHMVARYGEFILYRPPMSWRNAWLWGAPPALMLIGALVAWRVLRARQALSDQDHSELGEESFPT